LALLMFSVMFLLFRLKGFGWLTAMSPIKPLTTLECCLGYVR
jgi:hypothetical protein